MKMLLQIFVTFFKIGVFTFGGGYAMIPLIGAEVIDRRGWIARKDFLELLTLAQSAPGPIALNTAVFVGYKMNRYAGAMAAVMGVVVPSFTIILLIAVFFADVRDNVWVDAAFRGMRPAVVALIVAPVIGLARGMSAVMMAVAAAVAVAVWYWGLSPVWLLVAGAAAGALWAAYAGKEVKR